ncbi:ABC transporter ATP-binding protein [Bacillus sp. JJ722]|uniref:ABC transporter ATP-binding protein n=1 Tax=Bacillus sp. JJ722 TaxID=3122973 RepID=UPI003000327C
MIEVKGISKKYRFKHVLSDVSFSVKKGEITCLIGVNGTGKSTTLKAILGITPFTNGDITVDGVSVKKKRSDNIAYVADHMTMLGSMKIKQAFQYMKDFYPRWNEERAEELVNFFKMNVEQKIGELSKGNAAKVSLILGLSLNTDYILLDEPFSGVDMFAKEKIRELFSTPFFEGRGVLLTTHEIDEVEHLLDRVVILNDGVIAQDFYTEQVRIDEGMSVIDKLREVYEG